MIFPSADVMRSRIGGNGKPSDDGPPFGKGQGQGPKEAGTSAGAKKGWDIRGRGQKDDRPTPTDPLGIGGEKGDDDPTRPTPEDPLGVGSKGQDDLPEDPMSQLPPEDKYNAGLDVGRDMIDTANSPAEIENSLNAYLDDPQIAAQVMDDLINEFPDFFSQFAPKGI